MNSNSKSDIQFFAENIFFTTRTYAALTGISLSSASRSLKHKAQEGGLVCVTRGIWCQPEHYAFTRFGAVPYLLGGESGYVSFLSALHRQAVISQIPSVVHIATTGHSRKLSTPIGDYHFFHLDPEHIAVAFQLKSLLMQDFLANGHFSYLLASPEQALIDTLHISTRKGKRFKFFPELDFTVMDPKRFSHLLTSIPKNTRIRITKRLQEFDSFPLSIYSPPSKTQRNPQDSSSPKGA